MISDYEENEIEINLSILNENIIIWKNIKSNHNTIIDAYVRYFIPEISAAFNDLGGAMDFSNFKYLIFVIFCYSI